MRDNIKELEINFDSEWFQSGYYVYVISITHVSKGNYYYVGQTGDRKHVSARSPFYRLMGHFNPYNLKNGTDSQLIKGLINNNLIELPSDNKSTRICIEEAIQNKSIIINPTYFKISDFDKADHSSKRENVEEIESALIKLFSDKKLRLFNNPTKIGSQKNVSNTESIKKAKNIFDKTMRKKGSKTALMQLVKAKDFTNSINSLIKSEKASISIYDNWMPDANNAEKEVELNDFLKHNFNPQLANDITNWWLFKDATTPNWDLVSTCTIKGERGILLVEAKAHSKELEKESKRKPYDINTTSQGTKENHKQIAKAIEEANNGINKVYSGISISRDNCYQLSNRVAYAWWLANQGIPVVLLYLGFLNCQDMNDGINLLFAEDKDWQDCFTIHAKQVGVEKIINKWVDCGESGFTIICRSY